MFNAAVIIKINNCHVLKKIRKIFGVTYFGADLNKNYAKYFEDCGIGVVAMEGMDVSFRSIPDVPADAIYSFIKKKFLEHTGADAVYILGSALDALGIVAVLEQDLGVPVCNRLPPASGKFSGACMSVSRSRAMAACWRPCRRERGGFGRESVPRIHSPLSRGQALRDAVRSLSSGATRRHGFSG